MHFETKQIEIKVPAKLWGPFIQVLANSKYTTGI